MHKNSPTPIHMRDYYLLEPGGNWYEKAVYHQGIFQATFERTGVCISARDLDELIRHHDVYTTLKKRVSTDEERWFMENAPGDLIRSLAVSYTLRYVVTSRKIPNIECSNWSTIDTILSRYLRLLAVSMNFTRMPRRGADAVIRTTGKHFRNLRYGHIHLSLDYLENRPVWAIHWDTTAMDTLNIPATITHWLHDDVIS